MMATMRFPFTPAQWQELERQAMIYKYMMASVPVPPDLLIHINSTGSRYLTDVSAAVASQAHLGRNSCFNLRFSNSTDPEPGRCRRTDGKKWRCSRDVAPDQKYCERHMHRGRPRSRKPVEVRLQGHTRPAPVSSNANAALTNLPVTSAASSHLGAAKLYDQASAYFPKSDMKPAFQAAEKEFRYLDNHAMAANQEWELMHTKLGMCTGSESNSNASVLQPYEQQLNLNNTGFGNGDSIAEQNDQCYPYLNTNLTPLDDSSFTQRHPHSPRRFIDAWSNPPTENTISVSNGKRCSALRKENLPLSSLTLSMATTDQIQMGLGVNDPEQESSCVKSETSSWMNSVPWLASPPLGGPLGEVLQSGAGAVSNSASPRGCSSGNNSSCGGLNLMTDVCGDWANSLERPPSRVDSSPSGVLQRTLVSLSDSSSSSSPTFAAAKSEIGRLQWLCHSKLQSP